VTPGVVRTIIHADAGEPDRPDRVAARVPLGPVGRAGGRRAGHAWLLGSESPYTTGAVLRLAGGL
jgi:hypothetical protein